MFDLLKNTYGYVPDYTFPNIQSGSDVLALIVNFFLAVGFSISLIGVAYGFVMLIISQGDKTAFDNAKNALLYSTVGFFVCLLAFAIKTAIINSMGITDTNVTNPLPNF